MDFAVDAEADAGSENNQASQESGSFGNPSSSASLINESDFEEGPLPDFIAKIYEENPYESSMPQIGGGFQHNIKLLQEEQKKYSPLSVESGQLQNEINRLKFESNNSIENNRTRTSRNFRNIENQLKEKDNKLVEILNNPDYSQDLKITAQKRIDEEKKNKNRKQKMKKSIKTR
jgi:hypothetical protein